MKKVLSFIMAIVMVMSLTIPCTADEITGRDWSGYNVSTVNPFELGQHRINTKNRIIQ